jgi:hypothetical protein
MHSFERVTAMPSSDDKPQPFSAVLLEELSLIDGRRAGVLPSGPPPPPVEGRTPDRCALDRDLVGMGISGGGIRSATFNLGILQGLADHGLLPHLDYLSTVSGGGYIGCWLHGVIRRMHDGCPGRANRKLSPQENPVPGEPADDPVGFLRKYSNYLAPRFSLLSTDVWVIGVIWLRNMFLNWCVLVPFLAAALLLPVVGGMLRQGLDGPDGTPVFLGLDRHGLLLLGSYALAGVLLSWAVAIIAARLQEVAERTFTMDRPAAPQRKSDAGRCAMLIFCSAALMGSTPADPLDWRWWWLALAGAVLWGLFLLLQLKGGFLDCYRNQHDWKSGGVVCLFWMPPVCAAFTALLTIGLLRSMREWTPAGQAWYALTLGPPLVLLALAMGVTLLVGLMGADYPDSAREWVSRLGALVAIGAAAWMALFCLGVHAPLWIAMLFAIYWKTGVAAVSGWLATSAAGVFSARSSQTHAPGTAGSNSALEIVARIAPMVFMAGFLGLISCGLHWGIRAAAGRNQVSTLKDGAPPWTLQVIDNHWQALAPNTPLTVKIAVAFAILLALSFLLASRININEFSMHHFYKNRLVRCYLGASQGRKRDPNSWTGFDPQDDIPLKDLHSGKAYYGPYAIVNTAVNLNSGSELAKQERKAGSFVYTPLYCGFTPEHSAEDRRQVSDAAQQLEEYGYRLTDGFGGKGGPHLGSAMAISGAAANPNMGFHT